MKRTLAALVSAGAALAILTACGSDDGNADAADSTASETYAESETTSAEPETDYDRWAAAYLAHGGDDTSTRAFEFQSELCTELRNGGTEGTDLFPSQGPAQLLHDSWGVGQADADTNAKEKAEVAEFVIIPTLCPEQAHWLADAKAGRFTKKFPTAFMNGKFLVGERIAPGTYTIAEQVTDCYWERSDAQGEIIDNNFISIAPSVTVTIADTDAGFTSRGCGKWVLVE